MLRPDGVRGLRGHVLAVSKVADFDWVPAAARALGGVDVVASFASGDIVVTL